jgi:hypothetical protein
MYNKYKFDTRTVGYFNAPAKGLKERNGGPETNRIILSAAAYH